MSSRRAPSSSGSTGRFRHRLRLLRYLRRAWFVAPTAIVFAAVAGPHLSPYDPEATSEQTLQAPSFSHPFGTDQFGRDILARVIDGAQQDLAIVLLGVGAAFVLGVSLGATSGFAGGIVDGAFMRAVDVVQSFPSLILALALVATVLRPGIQTLVIVIAVINIPTFARVMRVETLAQKSLAYVDASRCVGNSWARTLLFHVLPNAMGPVFAAATLALAWSLLDVAALSFIGVGVQPPTSEWGVMLFEGAPFVLDGKWWTSFFPGLAISLTVLIFVFLGDALQDRLDPRRRAELGFV